MRLVPFFACSVVLALCGQTLAAPVSVTTGQTNVLLDTATLASAASLNLSGVSAGVIAPGNLGAGSVAFPINSRTAMAPMLPTTFTYDSDSFLTTFAGKIEHAGSVLFNSNTVEVGNFTIAFDAARVGTLGGKASGFYVASTTGISAILFDVENPSALTATATALDLKSNLLVSPEFAGFLQTNQLATANLAGADVGDAFVQAVPEPSTLVLAGLASAGLVWIRRRK